MNDWPLIEVGRSPAATYWDGDWWAVIETRVSGVAPLRLTKGSFANHTAALACARDVIAAMRAAAEHELARNMPVVMPGKDNDEVSRVAYPRPQ